MDDKNAPRDDDDEDLEEAIVAADDTGLVQNEITIVRTDIEEHEAPPEQRRRRP